MAEAPTYLTNMPASPTLLSLAHQSVKEHLYSGALAIDATLGNGYDTLFLAQHVAPAGRIFGFDIQAAAITATRTRLQNAGLLDCVTLFTMNHTQMRNAIPSEAHGKIQAIMFNLGYLPGADKSIITTTCSTLAALAAALHLLSSTGILSVLAYPGHSGGNTETLAVKHWVEQLDAQAFQTSFHLSTQAKDTAPQLFIIKKAFH